MPRVVGNRRSCFNSSAEQSRGLTIAIPGSGPSEQSIVEGAERRVIEVHDQAPGTERGDTNEIDGVYADYGSDDQAAAPGQLDHLSERERDQRAAIGHRRR